MVCLHILACVVDKQSYGITMESLDEIVNVLRENLSNYMDGRPGLSIRSLSKLSGCNRYFLGKLTSKEAKLKGYDLSQVLLLLQFLNEKDSLRSTIESADSPIRDALMTVFGQTARSRSGQQKPHTIPESLLYDFDNFMILSLAAIETMNLKTFEKCSQVKSRYKIEYLLDSGYIEIVGNRLKLSGQGETFQPPLHIIELHLPKIIKMYFSSDRLGSNSNAIGYYYQGLNEEGVQKLHAFHKEFMEKVANLLSDNRYAGDHPVFSANIMSSFDNFTGEKHEKGHSLYPAN